MDQHSTEQQLRRSRAQVELSSSEPSCALVHGVAQLQPTRNGGLDSGTRSVSFRVGRNGRRGSDGLTAAGHQRKHKNESDDEDLFSPAIYALDGQETEEIAESGAVEEDTDENLMDTRDYYRLVKFKFESNRSLANSEKYDHCPAETEETPVVADATATRPLLPPPDCHVALQTIQDFIAEQQRYCAIKETADADVANATPAVEFVFASIASPHLEQVPDSKNGSLITSNLPTLILVFLRFFTALEDPVRHHLLHPMPQR